MNIGGLQRFSLNDFPGHVAAVVFTQGCNFRCPFCHNGALIPAEPDETPSYSEADVFAFLHERRKRLDGLVISGGEPTVQPDLATFIRRARQLDLIIKLDTNGSRPRVLRSLLDEGLLDYVAMDVKAPLEHYARLAGTSVAREALAASMQMIAASGVPHQFRTTVVETLLTKADVERIRQQVPAGSEHRLQRFEPEHAFDPALRTTETTAAKAG
jgi:pyruvate formate lyase activating enzyme